MMRLEVIPGLKYKRWLRVFLWRFDLKRKFTGICSFQAMPEMDFRPRGKGRKLAWQGACSEKTKEQQQRSCAPFSSTWTSGSEAGTCWQGEHPDLRIEAMYVGGDEDENI